jgi:membrane-associated phospholipid phosphatase
VVLATLLDRAAYPWMVDFGIRSERVLGPLYDVFRTLGEFSTWLLIAALLASVDLKQLRSRPLGQRLMRARLLLLSGLCAGATTPLLKALVRRERPRDHDGEFWFRPYADDLLSSSGFGMPSGDVALAFACLFMLWRLFPGAWRVLFLLGYGCALCRMLSGAHFLSDVLVGGVLGCACASVVWGLHRRRATSGPAGAQRSAPVSGILWFLALAAGLLAVSSATAWAPAGADEIPGLYFSAQRTDSKAYYLFERDGTYTGAILTDASPSRLEHLSGTWDFGADGLRLGDEPPLPVESSGKLLRWSSGEAVTILSREGR